jgi:hypothetical protein
MSVYETIITAYPELIENESIFSKDKIVIQDDSDGLGEYLVKWEYSKPLPKGLKLGK